MVSVNTRNRELNAVRNLMFKRKQAGGWKVRFNPFASKLSKERYKALNREYQNAAKALEKKYGLTKFHIKFNTSTPLLPPIWLTPNINNVMYASITPNNLKRRAQARIARNHARRGNKK